MNRYRAAAAALVVVVVAAVALYVSQPVPAGRSGPLAVQSLALIPADMRQPAPEFTGLDGWINSAPLSLASLRGHIVLVDFWTYSCVNCVRTLPHERDLYDRYRADGFVLIGMHSPEFDFEKIPGNVAAAVRRDGVTWPVALDSQMATWSAFNNTYWPAAYVIDQQGRIAYTNFGEGNYAQTDAAVAALLGVSAPAASPTMAFPDNAITPEIYVGSERGAGVGLAAGESYGAAGQTVNYPDGSPTTPDHVYLTGQWVDHGEYMTSASAGHVRLLFHAHDVFIVAGPQAKAVAITVTVDGQPVSVPDATGVVAAVPVTVNRHDLYHVLTGQPGGNRLIDIAVPAGIEIFTFTFG